MANSRWAKVEPGSTEDLADAETRKKIQESKKKAGGDLRAMDLWAQNGSQAFVSKPDRGWQGDGESPPRRTIRR